MSTYYSTFVSVRFPKPMVVDGRALRRGAQVSLSLLRAQRRGLGLWEEEGVDANVPVSDPPSQRRHPEGWWSLAVLWWANPAVVGGCSRRWCLAADSFTNRKRWSWKGWAFGHRPRPPLLGPFLRRRRTRKRPAGWTEKWKPGGPCRFGRVGRPPLWAVRANNDGRGAIPDRRSNPSRLVLRRLPWWRPNRLPG